MAFVFDNATLDAYSGSLKAGWLLEDATDSIDGYNLQNNNAVTFVAGKNNNAANFVRASSQSLEHTPGVIYDPNNDFALSCWLDLDDATTSSLITQFEVGGGTNACGVLRYSAGQYQFLLWASTPGITRSVAWTQGTGSYIHVVIIRDGNTLYFYGNDVERSTDDLSADTMLVGDTFLIGARDFGTGPNQWMDGQVDEAYLWENISFADAAARVAFVAALYNSGTGRFLHELDAFVPQVIML